MTDRNFSTGMEADSKALTGVPYTGGHGSLPLLRPGAHLGAQGTRLRGKASHRESGLRRRCREHLAAAWVARP
jgi:hypothetical protein